MRPSPDSIITRCLLPIEQGGGGATSCTVELNSARPSVRVIVNKGVDREAVARVIWATFSRIRTEGSVRVFIRDADGASGEVRFDERAQEDCDAVD